MKLSGEAYCESVHEAVLMTIALENFAPKAKVSRIDETVIVEYESETQTIVSEPVEKIMAIISGTKDYSLEFANGRAV